MPIQNHVHKYLGAQLGGEKITRENGKKKFIKSDGYPIFRCALDDCSHFISLSLALGWKSICWRCGQEMFIKSYNLKQTRPHHKVCEII